MDSVTVAGIASVATLVTGAIVVLFVVAALVYRRRRNVRPDVGQVSSQWIAQHRGTTESAP